VHGHLQRRRCDQAYGKLRQRPQLHRVLTISIPTWDSLLKIERK